MTAEAGGAALALGAGAFLASATLAGLARRYALAHSILDHPNERSSHSVPTPRGGGLAIALVVLAGLGLLAAVGRMDARFAIGLGGGGALIAAAGWLDDRRGLPALPRLLMHTAAAAWSVGWVGGMPFLTLGGEPVALGPAGSILAVLGVVWATNLYNFMDGIDGLAAGEAAVVGLVGALLLAPRAPSLASVSLLAGTASAGFLLWNWPPARLFMGDVGSGFLGHLFGTLAVISENERALPALLWLVLLAPFFVDATVTLLRRVLRGERWLTPHRSHAYQRAVQAGWSHGRVAGTVTGASALLGVPAALVVDDRALLVPVLVGAGVAMGGLYLAVERWRPMGGTEQQCQAIEEARPRGEIENGDTGPGPRVS